MPSVHAVSTALPSRRVAQSELRAAAAAMMPGATVTMFDNARIDARAVAMPLSWYARPRGFRERNAAYAEVGLDLCEQAARRSLAQAGLSPTDLTGVLFISTTGIATPSLDARLAQRLGCGPGVLRLPVWGLGCAGGVAGLNRAAELAKAHPDGHFLVVCLELCTLSFQAPAPGGTGGTGTGDGTGKKAVAAASLFGDGCASAIVSGDRVSPPGALRHERAGSHLFPGTERVMGWDVEDDHMEVVLSPEIPAVVRAEMRGLVDDFMDGGRPDRWVLHPGGARVVDAYRDALGLTDDDLAATDETLAAHGNMSSPTVLFVLQNVLETRPPAPGETLLLGALGPGFASELALVRA